MNRPLLRAVWTALSFALALVPAGVRSATVNYAPPALGAPAGRYRGLPYAAVLPSGRLALPFGTSVVTGTNGLGLALSPDGRYAIASDGDENESGAVSALEPAVTGGYSLTVVDTARMVVVSHYAAPGQTFFGGLAAVRDPRDPEQTLIFAAGGASNSVFVLDLDSSGRLVPDARRSIAIPGPSDAGFADRGISFPANAIASADGRRIYVVDAGGESVAAIDVATQRLLASPQRAGFSPSSAAVAGSRLLVTNEGLMRYGLQRQATQLPPFETPPADPQHASSLSLFALAPDGSIGGPPDALPMDRAPDGERIVGGAHPTAIVTTPDEAYAFVAMTNVDRIATVALGVTPRVIGGTELRLFDRGPYGTQPVALALSRDASRLYVALSGLDAVAVIDARDPVHLHRLGLIPTGWAPSALALADDGRTLFVVNQKGLGHDSGFVGNPLTGADADTDWSTLERIDLAQVKLAETTRTALAATRIVTAMPPPLPRAIRNVVLIVEGSANYDEMLGDLGVGPGVPSFALYGATDTPNLHALARRFGLAGNIFADPGGNAQQILTGGIASAYTERMAGVRAARLPLGFADEDPEDALRLGNVFDELARHHLSFRDYGGFLDVSGTTAGGAVQDVPAPAALDGNVDANYPDWSSPLTDARRAREFVRDFGALAAARREPRFTYVALPPVADGPPGAPPGAAIVAEDHALGTIVAFLTRLPSWRTTAVFVVPAGAHMGRDHIDASRTWALVISPYAKPGYIGMRHLSGAAILKTIDRVFALPPLSLGDLLANDMGDFFASRALVGPYVAARAPATADDP